MGCDARGGGGVVDEREWMTLSGFLFARRIWVAAQKSRLGEKEKVESWSMMLGYAGASLDIRPRLALLPSAPGELIATNLDRTDTLLLAHHEAEINPGRAALMVKWWRRRRRRR